MRRAAHRSRRQREDAIVRAAAVVAAAAVVLALLALLSLCALLWWLSVQTQRLGEWVLVRRGRAARPTEAAAAAAAEDDTAEVDVLPAELLLSRRVRAAVWLAARAAVVAVVVVAVWLAHPHPLSADGFVAAGWGAVGAVAALVVGVLCHRWDAQLWAVVRGWRARSTSGGGDRGLDRGLWDEARQRCFRHKGRLCYIGLRCCSGIATEVDHIKPLANGGARYDLANLQPSCGPCNRSKGTKPMSALWGRKPPAFNARRRRQLVAQIEGDAQ